MKRKQHPVVIRVVQGEAQKLVVDYKNGTSIEDLAKRLVELNLSNAVMPYIALRVASYMTDLDEQRFRKSIRDLI
jgi:hypothetical protein